MLIKMTLIKVSYQLECILLTQFNQQNRCLGKPQRKLQSFQLRVFCFEYGANWKTQSWKTSEFDHNA